MVRMVYEEEAIVRRTQRASNEEKRGMETVFILRHDLKISVRPPPFPCKRGELMND